MANVLTGFRDFITKGNLIETAVALVMALATTALVKALIDSLITPIIGAIFGEPTSPSLTFTINGSEFFYGAFINALIIFVSTGAAVYFFIVKPYQAYQERKGSRLDGQGLPSLPLVDSAEREPLRLLHPAGLVRQLPRDQLAEQARAGIRRMVAVVGQLGAHQPGPRRLFELVVKADHLDVLISADRVDHPVELGDRPVGLRVAVVPGQHVGEVDVEAELLAAHDHPPQVLGGGIERGALGDVVDAALDDQHVGAIGARVQSRCDLVGALAEDAAGLDLERGIGLLPPSTRTGCVRRRPP